MTDPFGRSMGLHYDGSGRLDQVTDAGNLTSTFSYDGSNWVQWMVTQPFWSRVAEALR